MLIVEACNFTVADHIFLILVTPETAGIRYIFLLENYFVSNVEIVAKSSLIYRLPFLLEF